MAATVYEGMFILDSNRYAREGVAVADDVNKLIEKLGGQLLVSRLWDDRRLAYPIDGHKKGTYWLTYFSIESTTIPTLTNELRLNDTVLRNLFIKIDSRLVETLVEHAKTGTAAPEARPGARPDAAAEAGRPKTPDIAAMAAMADEDEIGAAEEDDKD